MAVGNPPRQTMGDQGPVAATGRLPGRPAGCHRQPTPLPRGGEGVNDRAGALLQMKGVERPQDGLAMRPRRFRVQPARPGPARHCIRNACRSPSCRGRRHLVGTPMAPVDWGGFRSDLHPPSEVPRVLTRRPVPAHLPPGQESPPAQQVHPIRTDRRRRTRTRLELGEECRHGSNNSSLRVEQRVRTRGPLSSPAHQSAAARSPPRPGSNPLSQARSGS